MAKERLRLPARMKGGGIKRATDTVYPQLLGALLDILPRCVSRKESNGEITKGIHSDQITAVIGEGEIDEAGHRNTQFLEDTRVGPYPREMQKAWDALRDEAADNYGFQEGFQKDEARERMGLLAEPTLVVVKNRGAAERKKARRMVAFVAERREAATDATREEGARHEEGEAQRHQEEADDSTKNMGMNKGHEEAISQAEREAAAAHADATRDAQKMPGAEITQTKEAKREADAKRRASNFLQAMGNPRGEQTRGFSREDYSRRRDKEPATSTSQAGDEVTPLEHKA